MTKQEKIQEAYGSRYISLKESINCNGWINQNVTTRALFDSLEFDEKINSMRPLELKGIENNNDWIKIESKDDLPNNWQQLHFVIKGFEENENSGYYYDGLFWNLNEAYVKEIVTHYQPILKPQPPIY